MTPARWFGTLRACKTGSATGAPIPAFVGIVRHTSMCIMGVGECFSMHMTMTVTLHCDSYEQAVNWQRKLTTAGLPSVVVSPRPNVYQVQYDLADKGMLCDSPKQN